MAYTPYQLAGTYSGLLDTLQSGKLQQQQSRTAVGRQKLKMKEDFQDELEKAQEAAKQRQEKHGNLFKGLNLLSSAFLGPLGAGIVKGLTSGSQIADAKEGAKKLLSNVDLERWDKTFLGDSSKAYRKQAEDIQVSTGDIIRGAIGGGITGYASSKLFGGGEQSPFQKWREGRQAKSMLGDLTSQAQDQLIQGGANELSEEAINKQLSSLLEAKNLPSLNILQSKTPGLSNLWENLTKQRGIKGGMEEVKSAMMLPMLLQMIMGGE